MPHRSKSTWLTAACARCLSTGRYVAPRGGSMRTPSDFQLARFALVSLRRAGFDARVPAPSSANPGGLPVHGAAGDDWRHNGAICRSAARIRGSFSSRSQGTCSYVLTGTEKGMQETFGRRVIYVPSSRLQPPHSERASARAAHVMVLAEREAGITRGTSWNTRSVDCVFAMAIPLTIHVLYQRRRRCSMR